MLKEVESKNPSAFEPTAPGYKYITAQRNFGTKPKAAMADLSDNSIDAGANHIWFKTETFKAAKGVDPEICKIIIADNGHGMDKETLYGSFKLGFERTRTLQELGKFGIGGTMGCLSLARKKLTISRDINDINARQYDLSVVEEQDQWGSSVVDVEPWMIKELDNLVGKGNTGTMIILTELDKLQNKRNANFETSVSNHLSQVYCKFIADGSITVLINKRTVPSKDPIFWYHKDVIALHDDIIPGSNMRLRIVNVGDCTEAMGSLSKNQGGYIFRCGRLIESQITFSDSWPQLPKKHPNGRHGRWALYYDADEDEIMGTSAMKDRVDPSQAVRDRLVRIVTPDLKVMSKKLDREEKAGSPDERNRRDKKLSSAINSLPKKVQFEASPTGKDRKGKVFDLQQKIRDTAIPLPTYTVKQDSLGSGGEFAIVDSNPDQKESKLRIRTNLDHPYMLAYYTRGTLEQQEAIDVWTMALLLTLVSQPENNFDLSEFKREFSSKLNQITRKLDN